jgi:Ca-activated chloride channel family protein
MRLLRPIKNSLLLLLLIFAAQKMCAQLLPADDFFNSGAQLYISNNIPAAKERVETGLKIYPDDVKLKKLEELLKQQQQQQKQQQKQQNQSQQNQSQNQNSSQQQKNQQNQSQQNQQQSQAQKDSEKKSQEQAAQKQKEEEQKQQEQKAAAEKASGQTNDNQNAEGQPVAAGQMTPEEAKRLLDSQKGDEQFLQLKPQGKPEDSQRKIKDW